MVVIIVPLHLDLMKDCSMEPGVWAQVFSLSYSGQKIDNLC